MFVDEVHERSLDSDLLLVLLKDLLQLRNDYFYGAPLVSIPGSTHPVKEHHLEDVIEATRYEVQPGSEYARKVRTSASNKTQGLTAAQKKERQKEATAEEARRKTLQKLSVARNGRRGPG